MTLEEKIARHLAKQCQDNDPDDVGPRSVIIEGGSLHLREGEKLWMKFTGEAHEIVRIMMKHEVTL